MALVAAEVGGGVARDLVVTPEGAEVISAGAAAGIVEAEVAEVDWHAVYERVWRVGAGSAEAGVRVGATGEGGSSSAMSASVISASLHPKVAAKA